MQSPHNERIQIGVDVGGTFTDAVAVTSAGEVVMAKASSTPGDPGRGIMESLRLLAATAGLLLPELLGRTSDIKHGSTIATNAVLTRSGARVGLITTKGFEDTAFIMRAIGRVDGLPEEIVRRPTSLTKPTPLVAHNDVIGVRGRIDVRGEVVVRLNSSDVDDAINGLLTRGCQAIAVCLLNSWANPEHEETIMQALATAVPDNFYVTCSSRLVRVAGEYARTNTVLLDAYVGPLVRNYVDRLLHELQEAGFAGNLMLMQGNGGLAPVSACSAVATLQSGPAGGMLATAHFAELLGHEAVLTADMGGTSFDVGVYAAGYWAYADEPIFDRFRVMQPVISIDSIGAGGGTIARADSTTRRLIVGPESAGAEPGPAAYGRGGENPTVTDSNICLGIIDPNYFLGGGRELDLEAARNAFETQICEPLSLKFDDAVHGVHEIISAKMADLIRKQVIQSGLMPENLRLYAFGGASGCHAAEMARELGIGEVYLFPASPVFSALGIALADIRHSQLQTCSYELPEDVVTTNETTSGLEQELRSLLISEGFEPSDVIFQRYFSLRFKRQITGLELEVPPGSFGPSEAAELTDTYGRRYEEVYGTGAGNRGAGVEVYRIRVDAIVRVPKPQLVESSPDASQTSAIKSRRVVALDDGRREVPVYEWSQLSAGNAIEGPAIVEAEFTTVLIPSDWKATTDRYSNVVLTMC